MKHICEIKGAELVWMQPRVMERAFELRSGEDVLGTLRWNSISGSLANAAAADGLWTFKRTGFFNPRITVRAQGSDLDFAQFTPNWKSEGNLQLSTGQNFRWMGIGFWRAQWAFTKPNGEHLLEIEPHSSWLKKTAVVKPTPEGCRIPELSLLVLLGWYLVILRSDDDSAGAAVAAACG